MRMLGEPGAVAMIWMTLVSTGGAALLVYFWRRRATRDGARRLAIRPPADRHLGLGARDRAATFLSVRAWRVVGQHFDMKPQPTNLA